MYEYRKLTTEQKRELVEARRSRGFPVHKPPHFRVDGAVYLFTAACYEHADHMNSPDRRTQLLDHLFEETISAGVEMMAWVVLPNHYHFLALVEAFGEMRSVFRNVHGSTSHAWNSADHSRGRKVWYRYADRLIRSEAHYLTTLNYIHFNSVKHGLAATPYDWAESSVHWYLAERGGDWLRDVWARYPLKDYGKKWD